MRVLLFNGSSRAKGCTYTALCEIAKILNEEGIDAEILQVGSSPVRDCNACNQCDGKDCCIFDDDSVNEWIEKAKKADGFVFGTPVYYAHPTGRILSIMDRMFYASSTSFKHKPGAVIASARRGGTTACLDAIAKHITINQMPLISSTYWNMVHVTSPEETKKDLEGMQTMRNLARNMSWILKCIEAGKSKGIEISKIERSSVTNFIRE